ncbi:hypothetical protein [Francisella marina]|uniref:Head-tail adaptor protein n=1 Tax=Francisella marina TaxID=2249302 RepID=A0ABX5ZGP0_9GAMM|nr:hypothetical protein [Francisella marina]QEO57564.1 hypothetical protein F0R74_06750 [Francisella marina]
MANTVLSFAQNVDLLKVTQVMTRGRPGETTVSSIIKATVTTPKPEQLQALDIDYSLQYITLHTTANNVTTQDKIGYKGKIYRVIDSQDYSDYGYMKLLCVEDNS